MNRLLVVLALVLTSCSSESDGPKLADPVETTAQRENTTTTAGETSTTVPAAFVVGDRVESSRGNFFTLHAYEQPVAPPEFFTPDAGNEYAAADVEFCVGALSPDGVPYSTGPGDFELQMGDNTRRTFDIAAKEPALHFVDVIAVGDCVRGWVTWQVPAGVRPTSLVVLYTDPAIKFSL